MQVKTGKSAGDFRPSSNHMTCINYLCKSRLDYKALGRHNQKSVGTSSFPVQYLTLSVNLIIHRF